MTENNLNWRIELKEEIDFYDIKIDSIDCEYFEDIGSILKVHLENEISVDVRTIHESKGMQAETVVLFDFLSSVEINLLSDINI